MGQARDVVEQWWSLFEAGRLDEAAAVGQPDVEVKQPGGILLHGPTELISMLQVFREAFPDIRHQVLDVVESGDRIAVELTVTATHTGTFHTPQGDIPPTGRTLVWESVDFITLRDGKIASWHTYFDQMAFLAQLGLLPEPAAVA
jgi:steroid delta-isomerase-like uncharacterized protein